MKRKVIQIAGSTQLVSLPRQWAKRNNIQRGQEVEVQEDGDRIIITSSSEPLTERAELDITSLGDLMPRCVSAMYKRGVDSLRLTYSNPRLVSVVNEALAKDTVSFEILEQGENFCVIKHVGGLTTEFDSVLRRIFLLLNTMSEECITALKKKDYSTLKNLSFLEEANNRFTTTCMRHLNKKGNESPEKIGPLYYIVENIEQVADQYKYICHHFSKLDKGNFELRKDILELFERANKLVRIYSELFYKFDTEKALFVRNERNKIIDLAHVFLKKKINYAENWLVYHSINIAQKVYSAVDSLLILKL